MYKAVIFDLGKVLIGFNHDKMHMSMAKIMGISVDRLKEIIAKHELGTNFEKGLVSEDFVLQTLLDNSPDSFSKVDMVRAFSDIFEDNLKVKNLIPRLKARELKTAILSNTNSLHIKWLKNQYAFFDLFDAHIFSFEALALKPEQEIYQVAAEKLGLKASECIFIDDLWENIEGANKFGMHGIHFQSYAKLIADLAECGIDLE